MLSNVIVVERQDERRKKVSQPVKTLGFAVLTRGGG